MPKIKLTKGELKRQRDSLEQFRRYLPTLQLKKQQLQMKVFEARNRLKEKQGQLTDIEHGILQWVGVLADPVTRKKNEQGEFIFDLKKYVIPIDVSVGRENVAGAYIPVFEGVKFAEIDFDLFLFPFWIDRAAGELQKLSKSVVEVKIIEEQIRCLQKELRTTSQRVNLFEKVKIPEAQENIRKITIYLGDQRTNAVGISKTAKKKIELAAGAAM